MGDIYLGDLVKYLERKKTIKSDPASLDLGKVYDPFHKPPDFEMAKNHGKAKRVYKAISNPKYILNEKLICPCCGLPIKGELVPLMSNLKEIYHLGSGFVLFFLFIKYAIAILVIIFAISGMYNLISSGSSDDCSNSSENTFCSRGFIGSLTIANKRNNVESLKVQLILNLTSVVVIFCFFHYIRYRFRKKTFEIDKETITPADFTIILKGVSPSATEEEIMKWIQHFSTKEMELEIRKIHRTFDIKDYIKKTERKNALINKRDEELFKGNVQRVQLVQLQIEMLEGELEEMKKRGFEHTPIVFVTFRKTTHAEYMSNKFQKGLARKLLENFTDFFLKPKHQLGESRIKVERAPEPSDVLWENLSYRTMKKFVMRIFTRLATFVVVFIGFVLIILAYWGQNKAIDKFGEKASIIQVISVAVSIIIFFLNVVLGEIIRRFTQNEKFSTYTRYSSGAAKKLSIAQLINTAFTPLLAKIVLSVDFSSYTRTVSKFKSITFYGSGGILENMFYIFLINAIFPPLFDMIHPFRLYKMWKQKKYLRSGKKANITQQEANELFEESLLDLPGQYVLIIKTMLLTSFYFPAIPIVVVFSIFGLSIFYWTNKYIFLRRSALPNSVDDELTRDMVEYLQGMGFMLALGNLIFAVTLENSDGVNVFGFTPRSLIYITLGISLSHVIFPMKWLNALVFKIRDTRSEAEKYDEARLSFYTDYDIENPITRKTAIVEFMNILKYRKRFPHSKNGSRSRAPSSALDKIKAQDMVRYLKIDSLKSDKDKEKENIDFDILDDYAIDARRRTTVRNSRPTSQMELKDLKVFVDEFDPTKPTDDALLSSSILARKRRGNQQAGSPQLFADYLRRETKGSTSRSKNPLNSFSSIMKDDPGYRNRELDPVDEDQEENEKEAYGVNDSDIKILITNPITLTARNQEESTPALKDLANVTKSDYEESFATSSDFRINETEPPFFSLAKTNPPTSGNE